MQYVELHSAILVHQSWTNYQQTQKIENGVRTIANYFSFHLHCATGLSHVSKLEAKLYSFPKISSAALAVPVISGLSWWTLKMERRTAVSIRSSLCAVAGK